jgi:hypothetical protein
MSITGRHWHLFLRNEQVSRLSHWPSAVSGHPVGVAGTWGFVDHPETGVRCRLAAVERWQVRVWRRRHPHNPEAHALGCAARRRRRRQRPVVAVMEAPLGAQLEGGLGVTGTCHHSKMEFSCLLLKAHQGGKAGGLHGSCWKSTDDSQITDTRWLGDKS